MKNSLFLPFYTFGCMGLFFYSSIYIHFHLLEYCSEAKVHEAHHSFFSKSIKMVLLLRKFDSDLSVRAAAAKHLNNLKFNIGKNSLFHLRLFGYFPFFFGSLFLNRFVLGITCGAFEILNFFSLIFFSHFGVAKLIFANYSWRKLTLKSMRAF